MISAIELSDNYRSNAFLDQPSPAHQMDSAEPCDSGTESPPPKLAVSNSKSDQRVEHLNTPDIPTDAC